MSAHDEMDDEPEPSPLRLRVLEPAVRDIADILIYILIYTLDRWGIDQQLIYEDRLRRGLELLRSYPKVGRERTGRLKGYRGFQVAEHVVYYRVEGDTVLVARVAHARDRPPVI